MFKNQMALEKLAYTTEQCSNFKNVAKNQIGQFRMIFYDPHSLINEEKVFVPPAFHSTPSPFSPYCISK